MTNIETRFLATNIFVSGLLHTYYLLSNLNLQAPILAVAFLVYNIIVSIIFCIHVINSWTYHVPKRRLLPPGEEKNVAILIPSWNEPVDMIARTVHSVLNQDYPQKFMTFVLSDEQGRNEMLELVSDLKRQYPQAKFLFNVPPAKKSPQRQGEGKAGNLNSALSLVKTLPHIEYIETRDADDLVGARSFLRDVLGQLAANPKLGFVQTIKTIPDPTSDPFGNNEELFYSTIMLSKNKANAVFPCGSGVVWRKQALISIGDFPSWNLVEDFQSGAEALRQGWQSMYIPILGAVAQSVPTDMPNFYKQRATWAIDSIRFLFWGNKKGLNTRQKLQFAEPGLFYILSAITYLYAFLPAIVLTSGITPVKPLNLIEFIIFYLPFAMAMIIYPISLAKKGNVSFRSILTSLKIYYGLGYIYLQATFIALLNGANKKPTYKVTRKYPIPGIYLHLVIPQIILVGVLAYASGYHLTHIVSLNQLNYLSLVWAAIFILMNAQVVTNSWYNFRKRA